MSLSNKTEDISVSVIVPVYRAEGTLKAAVKSIQAQTHKNLEIILVDDGSPDKSGEICDQLAIDDNRIKVIHKKNGGVSSARNIGIQQAKADYLCFVDSDDEFDPTMIEKLVANQVATGAQLVVAGITEYHKKIIKDFCEPCCTIDFSNSPNERIIDLCSNYLMPFSTAKLYLRKLFVDNNLRFSEDLPCGEDHLLVFQYLFYSEKVSFIEKPLYKYYCFNSNGATRFFPLSGQIAIFEAKERFILKNCKEKLAVEYCAKNALRNLIARINYLAKRSIKDYDELGRAYDYYQPYISPFQESTNVFDDKDRIWLNENKELFEKRKIKALYALTKKKVTKKNKHIRNLKEFFDMPLKKKIKFIKSKLK